MKTSIISVTALLAIGMGSAHAADLPAKVYTKAPPIVAAYDPWDVAFGAAIASDYVFRGVSQSNRQPSVSAYFEPRFNITKDLQLYAGVAGNSISFANRASMEIDGYVGIRPTFGAATFDFGFWYYGYPGGECIDTIQGGGNLCPIGSNALFNGNVMKKDVSFYEAYAKVNYVFNDAFQMGATANYSPNYLNSGADGTYATINAKYTMPSNVWATSGIGSFISGEFGRQWLGTSDAFYGNTKFADYNTWNVGIGFTYKVFTLDIRYYDTDLGKGNCNAFTSDFTAGGNTHVTSINSSGAGSSWCGATGVVKLSADLTAMTNLK
jgi:hypothetical protein